MPDQAQDGSRAPTDEQVLADPSAHPVDRVRAALDASDPSDTEAIERVKAIEREGKGRRGILEWNPPSSAPTFESDERFGMTGWRERARWFVVDGTPVSPHAVAGALHDAEPGQVFTQAQVQARVEKFLGREL